MAAGTGHRLSLRRGGTGSVDDGSVPVERSDWDDARYRSAPSSGALLGVPC